MAWTAGSGSWRGIAAAAAATRWAASVEQGVGVRAGEWEREGGQVRDLGPDALPGGQGGEVLGAGVGPLAGQVAGGELVGGRAVGGDQVCGHADRDGGFGEVEGRAARVGVVVPGGVEVDSGQGPQGGVQVPAAAAGVADGGPEVGQGVGEVGEVGRGDRGGAAPAAGCRVRTAAVSRLSWAASMRSA